MKLATIAVPSARTQSDMRDGRLVIVASDHLRGAYTPYPNLLSALDEWQEAETKLQAIAAQLEAGKIKDTVDLSKARYMAPLPRTYAWLDGSAFIQHVILVRKARGAEPPEDLYTVPLMYQGISDTLMGAQDDIPLIDPMYGMDFEGEVAVIVDDVPMGTTADKALAHIKLIVLMNDVSLRNLIPRELATGFGFFHGKPSSSFAPYAVTPNELRGAWREGRVHLPLESWLNGERYGWPNAGEMHFSFGQLIEHAAKTRALTAGTIIGSGTVSNKDETVGSSCLAEKRMLEKIHAGEMKTPFMKVGDRIEFEMFQENKTIFGRISQRVVSI